jgi:hypothetical protein
VTTELLLRDDLEAFAVVEMVRGVAHEGRFVAVVVAVGRAVAGGDSDPSFILPGMV